MPRMPKKPARAAAPRRSASDIRQALLLAARRLAESGATARLDARSVAAEAGLAVSHFDRQFPQRSVFVHELMKLMLDEVRNAVFKLTDNMAPGMPRLKLAIDTYLAANLHRPHLRQLMQELQAGAGGGELVRKGVQGFMLMMELELKSLKWPRPAATSRLLTAAIIETAEAEQDSGRMEAGLRTCIYDYLDSRNP